MKDKEKRRRGNGFCLPKRSAWSK